MTITDANCIHGVVWWDCDECDGNFLDLDADVIAPALKEDHNDA